MHPGNLAGWTARLGAFVGRARGLIYAVGDGVPRDPARGLSILERGARCGFSHGAPPTAFFTLNAEERSNREGQATDTDRRHVITVERASHEHGIEDVTTRPDARVGFQQRGSSGVATFKGIYGVT